MTDTDCLGVMQELLASRVRVGTAYTQDFDTGVLTHQMLTLECGDLRAVSAPEPLIQQLMPVFEPQRTVN